MTDNLAKSIHYFLKPAIFPLLAIIFLFNSGTYISLYTFDFQIRIYLIIFVTTFVFPATFIPVLFSLGIFKSMKIGTKKENIIFISILATVNLITFFFLRNLPIYIDFYLQFIFIISTFVILVALAFTIFSEICYNMLAIGSLAGFICAISIIFAKDYFFVIAGLFLIAGATGYVNLKLEKNNQLQIYSAFIIGFFICLFSFLSV